jgi:hypothetical protein
MPVVPSNPEHKCRIYFNFHTLNSNYNFVTKDEVRCSTASRTEHYTIRLTYENHKILRSKLLKPAIKHTHTHRYVRVYCSVSLTRESPPGDRLYGQTAER